MKEMRRCVHTNKHSFQRVNLNHMEDAANTGTNETTSDDERGRMRIRSLEDLYESTSELHLCLLFLASLSQGEDISLNEGLGSKGCQGGLRNTRH